jgi:hypothetical protein
MAVLRLALRALLQSTCTAAWLSVLGWPFWVIRTSYSLSTVRAHLGSALTPEEQEAREKVRKLLALASRPGTPAEGAAELAAATTLAARHGLRVIRDGNGYEVLATAPSPHVVEPRCDTPRHRASPPVADYVECLWCTRRIRVLGDGPTPLYCDSACRANAQRAGERG